MQLIQHLDEVKGLAGSVVTDGMFDGIHLGHQQILQRLKEQSIKMKLPSVLLTYWPHPRSVLQPDEPAVSLLSSLGEKTELIEESGIDMMLVLPFSHDFSQKSHVEFVQEILVGKLQTRHLIVGYNHRFGKERMGNITYLAKAGFQYGFSLTEIGKTEVDALAISSTRIREALLNRQPELAQSLLGRPYSIQGKVVKGRQLGRTIGFATANLLPDEADKLIPANGVYITRARIGKETLPAMTNIGTRPTVNGSERSIETHVLGLNADLYDQEIRISFLHFLREEKKFSGLEELKNQLAQDRKISLEFHGQLPDRLAGI